MRALREATVNLDAIAANVEAIRRIVGTPHFLAVTKANGYGHGSAPVARAAIEGGADWLGVIDATEAKVLRDAGIDAPILTWLHAPDETFEAAVQLDDVLILEGQKLKVSSVHRRWGLRGRPGHLEVGANIWV